MALCSIGGRCDGVGGAIVRHLSGDIYVIVQPITVLKGVFKVGGGNVSLRKVFVVTQFSISIILISCTGIVFQQLQYMQNKSLGFDKEHLITLPYYSSVTDKWEAFRTEFLEQPECKKCRTLAVSTFQSPAQFFWHG
ncbi:MAG: hypothetical protein IPJ74_24905 [Saprospiraceae bacterium]|nr:hypothetical protein [Saprospiraceae bacterium]